MLNGANEVAVAAFLDCRIAFPGIGDANTAVLNAHVAGSGATLLRDLQDVLEADGWARARAGEWIESGRGVRR